MARHTHAQNAFHTTMDKAFLQFIILTYVFVTNQVLFLNNLSETTEAASSLR